MGWWDSFTSGILDVLSAPAKLFTGSGPLTKAAKSVFGRETGSLTPALNKLASEASVADSKGSVTASSLLGGLLKAPAAIGNFAEKNVVPALNWAEKGLGDVKEKVEKLPIIGGELGAAIGAIEKPLQEVSGLVGKGQEVIEAVKTPADTLLKAKDEVSNVQRLGKDIIDAVKRRDVGALSTLGKAAVESGQKAIEIGKMGAQQFRTMEVRSNPGDELRRNVGAQQAPRFSNLGARVSL